MMRKKKIVIVNCLKMIVIDLTTKILKVMRMRIKTNLSWMNCLYYYWNCYLKNLTMRMMTNYCY